MPLVNAASWWRAILRARRDQERDYGLRCREGCARNRALGASAECALWMPLWRTGGVPGGTELMNPPYARVPVLVNLV